MGQEGCGKRRLSRRFGVEKSARGSKLESESAAVRLRVFRARRLTNHVSKTGPSTLTTIYKSTPSRLCTSLFALSNEMKYQKSTFFRYRLFRLSGQTPKQRCVFVFSLPGSGSPIPAQNTTQRPEWKIKTIVRLATTSSI